MGKCIGCDKYLPDHLDGDYCFECYKEAGADECDYPQISHGRITEITGPKKVIYSRFQRLILPIGRELRIVRFIYWKLSGHTYLWGIHQFLADSHNTDFFTIEDDK